MLHTCMTKTKNSNVKSSKYNIWTKCYYNLNYIIFRHSKVIEHYRWLSEKSFSSNKLVVYSQATINNNSMVTVAKFKQLVQSIPDDILR